MSTHSSRGVSLLGRHRKLMIAMVRRELVLRHVNQVMGSFWLIGHPLFLMALFVFLFGVVFNPKVGATYELPCDYTVYILSGLVPWLAMVPALTTSCNSVVSNRPAQGARKPPATDLVPL
jgi:lipopolysaccharide transport system permease protein